MADSGNIKVVVRCRPMNSRERNRGASNLVEFIDQHQLVLSPPNEGDSKENSKATKKKSMPFSFDRAYDEHTEQDDLFQYIGVELLQHAFNGFNTCVFAYGQTGSGKSHSMVGYAEAKGIIPLTCARLFEDIAQKTAADPNLTISVEVSYIEIYNEKVRDLLNPKNKSNLKVREHPSLGPYVEDLSKLIVGTYPEIITLMDEGNKARTVAATNMNETSSRSHAVITLVLTQKRLDVETKLETEKVSRISMVDLAGSERANSTGATGARLKEGANINRSLTTLGKVIAALATASSAPDTPKAGAKKAKSAGLDNFVPYRDSVLTWLLKDSLGGNSKTAMIAAISPADYEETLSTLRYADQAKKIKNKAVVNEDPNAKLIRELKEELELLRTRVSGGGGGEGESSWDPSIPPEKQVVRYQTRTGEIKTVTKAELQEQLEQSEKIMSSLNESWEEKLAKTHEIQKEREKALEELGISVDKGNVGVHTPKKLPHLVNLNEDPLMSECLIYQIKPGQTLVGNLESGADVHIKLSGTKILAKHCMFDHQDGLVTVTAMADSMTMVNGKRLAPDEPKRLRSGYRVILGDFHVFRFNHPEEVRKARDRVRSTLALSTGEAHNETLVDGDLPSTRPDSPASGDVDWTYARREYTMAKLHGHNVNFDNLNEEDLEKLFEDISRARSKKSMGSVLGRPESRASLFDDNASESASSVVRPYSHGALTDDTSIDPWSQAGSEMGSMRFAGGTPMKEHAYSNQGASSPAVAAASHRETESLRAKVREYEEKITRMTHGSPGFGSPRLGDGLFEYSDSQKALLRKALAKWRGHTKVSMAEDALSKAVLVKEANVISKELGKRVTYQYTVVDDFPLAVPTSGVEAIAGLTEFDDVSDPDLAWCAKPCMGIKVLDYVHSTCYVWSMPKFEQRLQKMRNLYTFVDKPEYSRHFNWSDPFYEAPHPTYAFVASTLVPLRPLAHQISTKYRLPLYDRHTGRPMAWCSVAVKFVSLAPVAVNGARGARELSAPSGSRGPSSPTPSSSSTAGTGELPVGQKLGFQVLVDSISGISRDDFASVHLQVKLSSFAGNALGKDEVYTSVPVDLVGEESVSEIRLRRTLSFVLTPESFEWLRKGAAPIEVYAKLRPQYLVGLEQHDNARESEGTLQSTQFTPLHDDASKTSGGMTMSKTMKERLSENEMRAEERHHILASVQICELDSTGEYTPVPVRASSALDPGSFFLRQGLQRKLVLSLAHDSGRQFLWTRVTKLELGDVRLLDARGRIHGGKASDTITLKVPAKQQSVAFPHNGTSQLDLWAWWDSSVHDSLHLNRTTVSGHRVLVRLSFEIEVERCAAPIAFSMDLAVSINARDAKPPGRLMNFIEGATIKTKAAGVFGVKLSPPMLKRTKELWRLDTGKKYVRGQEVLGGWKARGVSLVADHEALVRRERRRAEVEAVRATLKATGVVVATGGKSEVEREELVAKAVELWKRAVRDGKEGVVIGEQPSSNGAGVEDSVAGRRPSGAAGLRGMFSSPHSDSHSQMDGLGIDNLTSTSSPTKLDRTSSTATTTTLASSLSLTQPLSTPPPPLLTATVTLLPRTTTTSHRGYLCMPLVVDDDDHWVRRFFALRRPFLHVFESSAELDEVLVINVESVRVEYDENTERLLGKPHVFGMYTPSNSYFLQAESSSDRHEWMQVLDGLWVDGKGHSS